MKQLKTWSQFGFRADVVGRVLLEARANQVPFLHGYRLGLANAKDAGFGDPGDNTEGHLFLLGAPRAPLSFTGLGTAGIDSFMNTRGIVGYYRRAMASYGIQANGPTNIPNSGYQDWTPCGFPVPGLWMVLANEQSVGVAAMDAVVTVLFDWISSSPLETAALYTSYGIDAVDATEREISGEIDFNRAPGGGAIFVTD